MRCALVFKGLHVEHVDERTDDCTVVLGDGLDEWRQPVHVRLAVRVQEYEHVARRRLRAEDSVVSKEWPHVLVEKVYCITCSNYVSQSGSSRHQSFQIH